MRRAGRAGGHFSRGPVRQERIFHVVYWAPGDTAAHAKFYQERLGFRLTESIRGLGFFMRGGASHDHHNLFLNNHAGNFGFQHVAYEVRDFDEVLRCGTHMEEQGWKSHVGPGRHYFGSGWFWYFENPAGGLSETGMDSDYIGDGWTAIDHQTIPPEAARPWMIRREEAGLFPATATGRNGRKQAPEFRSGRAPVRFPVEEAAAGDRETADPPGSGATGGAC